MTLARAITKSIRGSTIVVGISRETGEEVLVVVEARQDGTYEYVPVARVMPPIMPYTGLS